MGRHLMRTRSDGVVLIFCNEFHLFAYIAQYDMQLTESWPILGFSAPATKHYFVNLLWTMIGRLHAMTTVQVLCKVVDGYALHEKDE